MSYYTHQNIIIIIIIFMHITYHVTDITSKKEKLLKIQIVEFLTGCFFRGILLMMVFSCYC